MNFISLSFLAFAAVVLPVFLLVPARWKWLWLLAAGLFFYRSAGLGAVALLAVQTILVYFLARFLGPSSLPGRRRLFLVFGLLSSLGGLIVFKYAGFLVRSVAGLFGAAGPAVDRPAAGLAAFAGLSFYSLKLAGYVIDIYWKKAPPEKHFGYFALSVSFFPQLLLGPIDRVVRLLPELRKKVTFDAGRLESGVQLIAWGVFKKIAIADRLAPFVARMFDQPEGQGLFLLFGAYVFGFQLYCDFSGYSDIAIGFARIMGYETVENFRTPFASRSLPEFWTRWHISFSTWLRDYLFLPIAYGVMRRIPAASRLGIRAEAWAYGIGITATWFLGGLWHGAAWTFVCWGLLHGLYLAVSNATKKARRRLVKNTGFGRRPGLRHAFQIAVTFNLVSLAWIFFRAGSVRAALGYAGAISLKIPAQGTGLVVFCLILILLFLGLEALFGRRESWPAWRRLPGPVKVAAFALFLCLTAILAVDSGNEFIYAQF